MDYAVVHLDRPVVGRLPVPVQDLPAPVILGQRVTLIGFGSGIPAKIDMGGHVIKSNQGSLDFFVASTDSFGGVCHSDSSPNPACKIAGKSGKLLTVHFFF